MKAEKTKHAWITLYSLAAILFVSVTWMTPHHCATAQQPAQQPRTAEQAFKNIQVIKNMPASELQGAMSFMAASLGVDCSHCHSQPAMEKDDKSTKQTARRMLQMVNEINRNFGDKVVVNCATCHRGQTRPVAIPPLPLLSSPFIPAVAANETPLPTVDEVLQRYVRALGGAQALNKVTTRMRKGTVLVRGLQGTFELFEAAPNKSLLVGSMPPPLGSIHQAFDGNTGWVKNQRGVFEMSGEGKAQAEREANFHADTKLKEQYKSMSVTGRERVGNREFYIIEGTRIDGQIEKLLFDIQTGFLARRYWEKETYFGQLPNATDFDDYRKVGGVWLPFAVRRARAGTTFLQNISEIKLNVPMDDSMFKKPSPQK